MLFTSEPKSKEGDGSWRRGDSSHIKIVSSGTRSTGAMTSVAQGLRGKETKEYKPQTWSGEKGSESFTAVKMELPTWVGSLHDNCRGSKGRQIDGVGHQKWRNYLDENLIFAKENRHFY